MIDMRLILTSTSGQLTPEATALHALMLVSGFLNTNTTLHYNTILRAYVHSSNFSQAIHFFNHSVFNLGFVPDNYTYLIILKACSGLCSLEHGRKVHDFMRHHSYFKPNVYTKCTLMDMFAKCGRLDEARMVFDDMPQRERDLASWTAIICGAIHQGRELEALCLFEMMRRQGTLPNSVIMAAILPACCLKQGKTMHGFILKQGFDHDDVVGIALMYMYSSCGLNREMEVLLSVWSEWDIMIWNSVIAGHASGENLDLALSVFRKIWESELKPNSITLVSILPTCTKMGALKQGMEVHCYWIKSSHTIMVISVSNSLIDMYCKCGYLGLGLKVFDHMMEKDIVSYV